jgi:hypothetical protein
MDVALSNSENPKKIPDDESDRTSWLTTREFDGENFLKRCPFGRKLVVDHSSESKGWGSEDFQVISSHFLALFVEGQVLFREV